MDAWGFCAAGNIPSYRDAHQRLWPAAAWPPQLLRLVPGGRGLELRGLLRVHLVAPTNRRQEEMIF